MELRFLYTGGWRGHIHEMLNLIPVVKKKKQEKYLTFLVDAGNFSSGFSVNDDSAGEPAINLMNSSGYDAALLGSGDLGWGGEVLKNLQKKAQFPLLASNLKEQGSDESPFSPFAIIELGKIKLAFLGLVGNSPIEEFIVTDPAEALENYISTLHDEGVGIFIVLSNLGYKQNRALIKSEIGITAIIGLCDDAQADNIEFLNNVPLARTPRNPYALGSLSLSIKD